MNMCFCLMGWHYSTGSTTHTLWRHKRETLNISRTIQTWQLQEDHWKKDPDATEVQDFLQEHTNCQVYLTPLGQTLPLCLSVTACGGRTVLCGWLDELIEGWMQRNLLKTSLEHRTGRSDLSHTSHTAGRNKYMQPDWIYMMHCRHLGICAFALTNSKSHC